MERAKALFKKSDFLTIPDFPDYEINGYFRVRNKNTGKLLRFLKRRRYDKVYVVYSLTKNNRNYIKYPEKMYRQAVDTVTNDGATWCLIPSLGNNYEINIDGEVRNVKTKRPLKLNKNNLFTFSFNGKNTSRCIASLLSETFGIPFKPKRQKIPVILRREGGSWYFKSLNIAASFISQKIGKSASMARLKLSRCQPEIYGYKVTYLRGG